MMACIQRSYAFAAGSPREGGEGRGGSGHSMMILEVQWRRMSRRRRRFSKGTYLVKSLVAAHRRRPVEMGRSSDPYVTSPPSFSEESEWSLESTLECVVWK